MFKTILGCFLPATLYLQLYSFFISRFFCDVLCLSVYKFWQWPPLLYVQFATCSGWWTQHSVRLNFPQERYFLAPSLYLLLYLSIYSFLFSELPSSPLLEVMGTTDFWTIVLWKYTLLFSFHPYNKKEPYLNGSTENILKCAIIKHIKYDQWMINCFTVHTLIKHAYVDHILCVRTLLVCSDLKLSRVFLVEETDKRTIII